MHEIKKYLLAKILIERHRRQVLLISPLYYHRAALPLIGYGFQRVINQFRHLQWPRFRAQRPREIEKSGHQRARPVHFTRYISCQLAGQRIRVLQLPVKRFRRSFDHAQWITNLMRQPGRKLPQGRQPFGPPRLRLGPLELKIGFRQLLRHLLVLQGLASVLDDKAVHHDGRHKEEHDPDSEFSRSGRRKRVFLQRGIKIRAVSRRGESGPEQCAPGPEVDRRRHNRNVIDRIVTAVDPQLAGVVDQQGGQHNLDQDHGGRPGPRPFCDDPAFGQLHDPNGEQRQLLVAFLHRRQHRQAQQKDQPKQVHPLDATLFFFIHAKTRR